MRRQTSQSLLIEVFFPTSPTDEQLEYEEWLESQSLLIEVFFPTRRGGKKWGK